MCRQLWWLSPNLFLLISVDSFFLLLSLHVRILSFLFPWWVKLPTHHPWNKLAFQSTFTKYGHVFLLIENFIIFKRKKWIQIKVERLKKENSLTVIHYWTRCYINKKGKKIMFRKNQSLFELKPTIQRTNFTWVNDGVKK